MRYLRHIVCPVLLTVVLLLAVRGLLINHIRLPEDTAVRGLLPGQRAFVSLTYYGLRLPGEQWWGYHRWGYRVPEVGEFILFNLPASIPAAPVPQSVGIRRRERRLVGPCEQRLQQRADTVFGLHRAVEHHALFLRADGVAAARGVGIAEKIELVAVLVHLLRVLGRAGAEKRKQED